MCLVGDPCLNTFIYGKDFQLILVDPLLTELKINGSRALPLENNKLPQTGVFYTCSGISKFTRNEMKKRFLLINAIDFFIYLILSVVFIGRKKYVKSALCQHILLVASEIFQFYGYKSLVDFFFSPFLE